MKYAVKIISRRVDHTSEVKMLRMCQNHPNIVKLIDVFHDEVKKMKNTFTNLYFKVWSFSVLKAVPCKNKPFHLWLRRVVFKNNYLLFSYLLITKIICLMKSYTFSSQIKIPHFSRLYIFSYLPLLVPNCKKTNCRKNQTKIVPKNICIKMRQMTMTKTFPHQFLPQENVVPTNGHVFVFIITMFQTEPFIQSGVRQIVLILLLYVQRNFHLVIQ